MPARAFCSFLFAGVLLGFGAGRVLAADISPTTILELRCLACHGPTTQMGGLNLSTREGALRGGGRGPALIPGDPEKSLLLTRLIKDEMPPGAPLPAAQKDALRAWIVEGAHWSGLTSANRAGRDWWSLQPLREAPSPEVSGIPKEWRTSLVDRWVYAKLREGALRPAPSADKRTLIRRVGFDLLGLPPNPDEVEAFVHDERPDAYEKLVDRLLASPHYGERWARHWLDIVRFAESEGFERDLVREHAWPYRDYVIRSFNSDKSYLTFAREQLAGDVLEAVTRDGIIATSLLTLGPTDAVGLTSAVPAQRAGVREEQLEELVGVVSQTFLGLTVNCARCHDHKFDPISQKEYYQMKAAFQAVWQPTWPDPSFALDELFPHGRPVLTPREQRRRDLRIAALEDSIAAIEAELGERYRRVRPPDAFSDDGADVPRPLARWTFDVDGREDFSPLHTQFVGRIEVAEGYLRQRADDKPEAAENQMPGRQKLVAVSAPIVTEIRAKTLEAWIRIRELPEKATTVMEIRGQSGYRGASVDGIQFVGGQGKQWESYSIGRFRSEKVSGSPEAAQPGETIQLAIAYSADGTITLFRNGKNYGSPYKPNADTAAGRLQVYRPGDTRVRFPLTEHFEIAEARLYDSALSVAEVTASFEAGVRNSPAAELLAAMDAGARTEVIVLKTELTKLESDLRAVPAPTLAYSAVVHPLEPAYVLIRGNVNQKGEEVTPGGLSCIQGLRPEFDLSPDAGDAERRKAMAEWIANPDNPLFSRVIVNRLWQHHFGAGLVASPSDFGYNGGRPSHPELLDALAAELIRRGWSLKQLHKLILMSRTYRQSSRFDASAARADSGNRLLWRFQPRRLTGEEVRDSMLEVSGSLNREMYGPSFRPFKLSRKAALQIYEPFERDAAEYNRRTIYRMNVNTGGHPMLEALDCPLPAVKTPKRPSTTTPLQALSLMNNEFVQLRVTAFAERLGREAPGVDGQIERAFLLAFGRPPDEEESASSRAVVERHGLAALCWGIFNTSEFIYVQ